MFGRRKDSLFALLRGGGRMSGREKLRLVLMLSVPAMMGQLSTIVMQYIDAMMVGQLGAEASASIGLVSTSTWLFGGVCAALGNGFAVLVAHHIGAKEYDRARDVMRQAMFVCMMLALCVCLFCLAIHNRLPVWLGGDPRVTALSSRYFLVWSLTLPVMQLLFLSNAMLRVSGNMTVPFLLGVLMCFLDITFNLQFIPRWGVTGAAIATSCAGVTVMTLSLTHLLLRSPELSLAGRWGRLHLSKDILRRGSRIALPMAVEHIVFCGAQIASTLIVATLGTVAIAANTIGIVVESLCYMPGYGIGDAATALIGQSYGARRADLIRSFSRLTVWLGIAVMSLMGVVMYIYAPELMRLMNPDLGVQALGTVALRIEAFAEPMYAASIVVYCIFVGLGDTLVPCVMNLSSIWLIRVTLAALLAGTMGLQGVWLAMCIELNVRGVIFLIRLKRKHIVYNADNKG
ncbi:MAG: MATE family efflux transporter [Prevotellaceae bacterium]|nr:MATE family efflux transporter [Prevotellaceae bacterium]